MVGRTRFELSERICSKCEIISERAEHESDRLIIVIVTVVIAWLSARESITEKAVVSLSVGLVISYIVAVLASFPPIITIPLGENEAIRVFSPVAYPLCIQQYRYYDDSLFSYALCFGWPDGFHLLESGLMEDQSEFIHAAHYYSGLLLGLSLLLLVVTLVGILTLVKRKRAITRNQHLSSAPILVTLQFILLLLITNLSLLGSVIYSLGGAVVLMITLYPSYRIIREKGF